MLLIVNRIRIHSKQNKMIDHTWHRNWMHKTPPTRFIFIYNIVYSCVILVILKPHICLFNIKIRDLPTVLCHFLWGKQDRNILIFLKNILITITLFLSVLYLRFLGQKIFYFFALVYCFYGLEVKSWGIACWPTDNAGCLNMTEYPKAQNKNDF